ncbi:MAG: hypothetical protein WCV84_01360 [Patescibacteria group bacterium]
MFALASLVSQLQKCYNARMTSYEAYSPVLRQAMAQGLVLPEAAQKAGWLMRHGLHAEQALIGTGLLSAERYKEMLLATEDQENAVLHSEARRAQEHEESALAIRSIIRMIFAEAEERQVDIMTWEEQGDEVALLLGARRQEPFLEIPSALLSALIARLDREATDRGWCLERTRVSGHVCVVLRRISSETAQNEHPMGWMAQLRAFEEHPEGMLVAVQPDAVMERRLSKLAERLSAEERAPAPLLFSVASSEEHEEALHTALLGMPVMVLTDEDRDYASLKEMEIPVRVIKNRSTTEGHQWEVYDQ